MSKEMDVKTFREKMVDCLYGFIDEGIDECENEESGGFVISFLDGSKFEVHIVSIQRFKEDDEKQFECFEFSSDKPIFKKLHEDIDYLKKNIYESEVLDFIKHINTAVKGIKSISR